MLAVGIFEGGNLGAQVAGASAIFGWAFATSLIVFKLVDMSFALRVSAEEERAGLDRTEHGADSYPEFVFQETIAAPADLDPVGSGRS